MYSLRFLRSNTAITLSVVNVTNMNREYVSGFETSRVKDSNCLFVEQAYKFTKSVP